MAVGGVVFLMEWHMVTASDFISHFNFSKDLVSGRNNQRMDQEELNLNSVASMNLRYNCY